MAAFLVTSWLQGGQNRPLVTRGYKYSEPLGATWSHFKKHRKSAVNPVFTRNTALLGFELPMGLEPTIY